MPLLIAAIRTELRKLEKAVSEADFRLPDAVRTSRDDWQITLIELSNKNQLALAEIDFERLGWFKLNKEEVARTTAEIINTCMQVHTPVTMSLLVEEITRVTLKKNTMSLEVIYG